VVYVNDGKQSEIQFTESLNNMLNLTVQETLLKDYCPLFGSKK
jgi:hypothetical protein